jgi:hypothetical protein
MPLQSSLQVLHSAHHITHSRSEIIFRAHFGFPSYVVEQLWKKILFHHPVLPKRWGIEELFMALYFIKNHGVNIAATASRFGVHPQTFFKKLEISLTLIDGALPQVIFIYLFVFLNFLFI